MLHIYLDVFFSNVTKNLSGWVDSSHLGSSRFEVPPEGEIGQVSLGASADSLGNHENEKSGPLLFFDSLISSI